MKLSRVSVRGEVLSKIIMKRCKDKPVVLSESKIMECNEQPAISVCLKGCAVRGTRWVDGEKRADVLHQNFGSLTYVYLIPIKVSLKYKRIQM